MQIDIKRQKVSRHFNLGCFSISADRGPPKKWGIILTYRHGLIVKLQKGKPVPMFSKTLLLDITRPYNLLISEIILKFYE